MSRPRRRLLTVAAVAAAVLAACTDPPATPGPTTPSADPLGSITVAPDAPIELGTLLPTSGVASVEGVDTLRGVQLAVDFLDGKFDERPGKFLDHPIQLVNVDETCTPEGGVAGARILGADPKITGVIGTGCSAAAVDAADRVLSAEGIVTISPSAGDPRLTAEGTHQPFFLSLAPNGNLAAAVTADFAYERLQARTALVFEDAGTAAGGPPDTFRSRFVALGGAMPQVVTITTHRALKASIERISEDPPALLYYDSADPSSTCALIARIVAGTPALNAIALAESGGCMSASYLEEAGVAANGTYLTGPDPAVFRTSDFYSSLLPAYEEQFGDAPVTPYHAYAFDAVSVLFDALQRSTTVNDDGSLTIDRAALQEAAFSTSEYSGLTGTISCSELGECAAEVAIAVYRAPDVPLIGADLPAEPVYRETLAPADLVP